VATPGGLALLARADENAIVFLERHQRGDWGNVLAVDARENELSVTMGFRILSSYRVGDHGATILVITEDDRSSTCLLLPAEY
jgi:hypothetical protein